MSNTNIGSETGNALPQPSRGPSIDLQQRTLRVTNLDSKVSKEILFELFNQAGPVVNVVHKPDFAFIEFEDEDSVGYAMALLQGISLFGYELQMQPKLQNRHEYYRYLNTLKEYETTIACNPYEWWNRFGSRNSVRPSYLCRGAMPHFPIPVQPIQIPNYVNQVVQHNYPPQYPNHQFNHYQEPQSFNHNRYPSYENYHNRGYHNNHDANGRRYGDRYAPYARPMDNRYHNSRHGYSQSFDGRGQRDHRDYRDGDCTHRRSN